VPPSGRRLVTIRWGVEGSEAPPAVGIVQDPDGPVSPARRQPPTITAALRRISRDPTRVLAILGAPS